MQHKGDHRGYAIFTHFSGPGPYQAHYSIWKVDPYNAGSYMAVSQGHGEGVFEVDTEAIDAARIAAEKAIDSFK